MYKKDKFGKKFEYRNKLEKYEGKEITVVAELKGLRIKDNNICYTNLLVANLFSNNQFICNHSIIALVGSNKKRKHMYEVAKRCLNENKKIKFTACVYKYSTKNNSRENFGFRLTSIAEA